MKLGLEKKMAELAADLPSGLREKLKHQDVETSLQYMASLLSEIQGHLANGKISYATTIEVGSYFARIAGYFDQMKISRWKRLFLRVDRYVSGYHPLPLEEEYRNYLERKFSLFQPNAAQFGEPIGFKKYENEFTEAFQDKNSLSVILLPTASALDADVLMRLMSRRKISLVGLAIEPIQADGFYRPSGHFWYHDLRHESAKWVEKIRYMKAHQIPLNKERALDHRADDWLVDLEHSISQISDPNLRAAVEFISFSIYHDAGIPVVPSSYVELSTSHYFAALSLIIGRENLNFKQPLKSIRDAQKWFAEFWKSRLEQENEFLRNI